MATPGAWTAFPNGGLNVQWLQLMPDGRVLMQDGAAATWVLSPDANGRYANGTWTRYADAPRTHVAGNIAVLNDGSVSCAPGEFGTSAQPNDIWSSRFDPATNTWTAAQTIGTAPGNYTNSLDTHHSVFQTDDGRLIGSEKIAPASWRPGDAVTNSPFGVTVMGEEQYVTLPDGRAMIFNETASGAPNIRICSPGYDAGMIAGGSSSASAGVVSINVTTALASAISAEVAAGRCWAPPPTTKWRSRGPSIPFEIGPAGYMPKIGKVVLVTGWGGILTVNPDGSGLALAAHLGMEPDGRGQWTIGKIRAANNGQTFGDLTSGSGGSITIDLHLPAIGAFDPTANAAGIASSLNTSFFIPLGGTAQTGRRVIYVRTANNTRAVGIEYTNATASGNTITLNWAATAPRFGAPSVPFTTGDVVTLGRPWLEAKDVMGMFLPNGDMVIAGSYTYYENNGNFDQRSVLVKWDGVSRVCEPWLPGDSGYGPVNYHTFNMLPSGEVLVSDVNRYHITTLSTEEATPLAGSPATFTANRTLVTPGAAITITGTQLNGLHEGSVFGDDRSPRTNFPIAKFTNVATGAVKYGRTRDFTYRGIKGGRTSGCTAIAPDDLPGGTYDVTIVASGVESSTTRSLAAASPGGALFFGKL
jgi:hypothetical protein